MDSKETSKIALLSFYSMLLGLGSLVLFFFSMFIPFAGLLGAFLVMAMAFLFVISFLLGFAALLLLTIRRQHLSGWIYAIISILISFPAVFFFSCMTLQSINRRLAAQQNSGAPNMKKLGNSLLAYAQQHGRFPDPNNWCDELMDFDSRLTQSDFRHPRHKELELGECNFCFNSNLGGKSLKESDVRTVLLFEADGEWNLRGDKDKLQSRYSEGGYIHMMFIDKTIRNYWYPYQAIREYSGGMHYEAPRWEP